MSNERRGPSRFLAGVAVALSVLSMGADEERRLPVLKDNSIVLVEDEWHLNAGNQGRIRIKGNQHLVAMAFDTSTIKGKVVKSAVLVCRQDSATIRGVTISTVQAPWDEMKSNSLTSGAAPETGWGVPGTMFPAVTGGNGFSLVCQAKSEPKDGAYYWTVHPDLVHACAVGASYGITLQEYDADYSRNPTIWSREARGKEPYLLVTLGGAEPKPDPATELKVTHSADPDSLRLSLRAPKNGFAYEIEVAGKPLARWNTSFVRPGEIQVLPIRDLPLKPGETVAIKVVTLNRLGERSAAASVTAGVPNPAAPPAPKLRELTRSDKVPSGIPAIPLLDKYDESGKAVGDLPAKHTSCNEVFDGECVRLSAAKGEVVGFQALIKGRGKVKVECRIRGLRTDVFRALYVDSAAGLPAEASAKAGRIPDPLVPCDEIDLSPDVATPVCVDVYVPFDFAGKSVEGALSLSDGRNLPVKLAVRSFALPREASFLCEMNGYGVPDKVAEYYRVQEIACDHRVHANILHYSHSTAAPGARKCNLDMVMSDGRRMDERRYNDIAPGAKRAWWDDFTSVFGPYLSGAHFKSGFRGPVAAPGFYLTFHESWPLNVRSYFNGNLDAFEAFKEKPVYAETFVGVLRDFIALATREGWTKAGFQIYLNNKPTKDEKRGNPWTLDEPTSYWDYRALRFYGELVRKAMGTVPLKGTVLLKGTVPLSGTVPDSSSSSSSSRVRIDFRIDISRPEFDRGELAGVADLWVVAGDAFRKYHRLVMDRHEREGLRIWTYGSTSRVEDSNRATEGWVLDAWRAGATGVVPWQTINTDGSALKKADQLGLFIFADEGGRKVIRHSMRLNAYREAEQLIEYLELCRKRFKWTDGQMRAFVDRYVTLAGSVDKAGDADAGTARFPSLQPESFRRLREAAAMLLDSGATAPAGTRNP